jgi:hypothetical protein
MSSQLEALARGLVQALNDAPSDIGYTQLIQRTIDALDVVLTQMSKDRAEHPQAIEHALKVADAFKLDFKCDPEPEVQPTLDDPDKVWVACWMLVSYDSVTRKIV